MYTTVKNEFKKLIDFYKIIPVDDIKEITLLSIEEAEKLPQNILRINTRWWLRSPGDLNYTAALVSTDGRMNVYGNFVDTAAVAVRPALKISNLESLNLKIGGEVACLGDRIWYYIGDDLLLYCDLIGYCAFNKKQKLNEFEGSDIQKLLKGWLEKEIDDTNENKYMVICGTTKTSDDAKIHIVSDDEQEVIRITQKDLEKDYDVLVVNQINGKKQYFSCDEFKYGE